MWKENVKFGFHISNLGKITLVENGLKAFDIAIGLETVASSTDKSLGISVEMLLTVKIDFIPFYVF